MLYEIPAVWRILATVLLLMGLRRSCQVLCAPPRGKQERQGFTVVTAVTLFEKFCTGLGVPRDVDPEDVGRITKEGYYPSLVLAALALIPLAVIWLGTAQTALLTAVCACVFYFGAVLLFKKPLLQLGKTILEKHRTL